MRRDAVLRLPTFDGAVRRKTEVLPESGTSRVFLYPLLSREQEDRGQGTTESRLRGPRRESPTTSTEGEDGSPEGSPTVLVTRGAERTWTLSKTFVRKGF